tara:strand:+ start:1394 stop:2464 length:1071 start_codon:yes stop_codon:yes gene_type:complete
MKILVDAPLNSLSLGNVSVNIIKELKSKGHDIAIWPMNESSIDLSAYDLSNDDKSFFQDSINKRFDFLSSDIPSLKVWHLNGSENRKNAKQYLYTFYECSEPTDIEKSLCHAQTETIFSSSYAADQFDGTYVPLGLDPEFKKTDKSYLEDVVHFGLMGKFENRKHTAKIIQTWIKKYGNNNKYQLTCCVTNPFFKEDEMAHIISNTLGGNRINNINFLPYLKTNKEVNEFLNAVDIDLTGLSGGEGWNLPAFNATCLGKWSIVLNETSHKDWANKDNSILVESSGYMDVQDGKFFMKGAPFNQGIFYNWNPDEVITAMEKAEAKVGQINSEGQKLADKFTYSKTVDGILSRISKDS